MKKIASFKREGTLTIFLLYLLLSIVFVSFSFYQIKQQELGYLTRGLFSEHPYIFTFQEAEKPLDWQELQTGASFTVFSSDEPIRGFYYQDETFSPPMVSGRFFQEGDFYNGHKRVVVGKNISAETIKSLEEDGTEIIGVMGASYSSAIDGLILYNIDAFEQEGPFPGKYVVNTSDTTIIENAEFSFVSGKREVNVIDVGDVGALRFLDLDLYQSLLYGIVYVMLLVLHLLLFVYWVIRQRHTIILLWKLGIHSIQPVKRYARTFLVIISISYGLIGVISLVLLRSYTPNLQFLLEHAIILSTGYGLLILSSSLFWVLFARRMKQITERPAVICQAQSEEIFSCLRAFSRKKTSRN